MVDTELIIVMAILGVFSIVGTIGNFLVLYIYTKKRDRTTSNIFILTLAGTDFLTCLVLVPFNIVVIGLDHRLEIDVFCKLYMFLLTCNVPFSAFVMVAIAFDRYFCICHPFLHAINIPRAKAIVLVMAALACVFGILTSLMYSIHPGPLSDSTTGSNITCLDTVPSSDQPYNTSFTGSELCDDVGIMNNGTAEAEEDLSGVCVPYNNVFGENFIWVYQKIYAGFYLLSFLIVFVLYGLIYRAIHLRRALKAKRKRSSLFPAAAEISMAETQMTALNGNNIENNGESSEKCAKKKHPGQIKDKNFYANIRTAAMLFIVTVVFLLAFLPAWLMAHGWIPYSPIIFYMYFLYNVANPVIYAFMNMSFRTDLRSLLCSRR
ncbi:cholecystokinin receptor type A-like [Pecten maximus]|uniref:cholecystokinin receptor type A-like n=1 Tax=Pecten maximus TaxID=6579 RepID=UPI0014580716|nr:cholecystokinin receptor type A-like [Pecten maximus]XP_033764363.1 cholecystokinin receptor type A-like [Pecten maximus]